MERYLVAYDITSNSKRRKTAHLLEHIGTRLQKSVYWVEGTPRQLAILENKLLELLDDDDELLLLPCCATCFARARSTSDNRALSYVA